MVADRSHSHTGELYRLFTPATLERILTRSFVVRTATASCLGTAICVSKICHIVQHHPSALGIPALRSRALPSARHARSGSMVHRLLLRVQEHLLPLQCCLPDPIIPAAGASLGQWAQGGHRLLPRLCCGLRERSVRRAQRLRVGWKAGVWAAHSTPCMRRTRLTPAQISLQQRRKLP